jgi:UDP-3-O-acyl-N-acetylglucosamine deacetylase
MQHTLASEISQSGVGLHSGINAHIRVLPAAVGQGALLCPGGFAPTADKSSTSYGGLVRLCSRLN